MINKFKSIFVAGLATAFMDCASSSVIDFWHQDVWQDPERPFLFYGQLDSQKDVQKNEDRDRPETKDLTDRAPDDTLTHDEELAALETLKGFQTVKDLQAEVKARLDAAVMNPNTRTISLYLQANAFLIDKAGAFAQSWRTHLVQKPQYDWTAQHPSVNAATVEIARIKREQTESDLASMAKDWGFVLVADNSPMTNIMAGIVENFAARFGFELVSISTTPVNPYAPNAQYAPDLVKVLAGGIHQFPALVLVNRADITAQDARLIATGVVDAQELGRRTASFVPVTRPDAYASGWLKVGTQTFQ